MAKPLFLSYLIEERSYISFIKREIHNLVKPFFTSKRTGEIDIVISELCSNLVKHAGSGELLYRLGSTPDGPVFEVLCIDNGPGIVDLQHSMRDGISTTNTLGQGIGSITRLCNFSQIYSQENWGTVVYCKIFNHNDQTVPRESILFRSLNVAKPGELVSGDGGGFKTGNGVTCIFAGDGLGHGINAHDAVEVATEAFMNSKETEPSQIIREMHDKVKKTRGLVGTIAVIDHERKKWRLCGVGNIQSRMQQGLESKAYICNNGIIGLNIPTRIENYEISLERFQQLILCSDGIKTRWDISKYPSILKYDPMILAGSIYKDHARKTDDMSIIIVKVL